MDGQFTVDVPRIVFFVDHEWVPTTEPAEVWDRLVQEYNGDKSVATHAAACFKQQFLAEHYISEVDDLNGGEILTSHVRYRVTLNTSTGLLTIEKDFLHAVVLAGDLFNRDFCVLTIVFNPYTNREVHSKWVYTIDNMRNCKKSIVLEDIDAFH
jgi:hypothetical protein